MCISVTIYTRWISRWNEINKSSESNVNTMYDVLSFREHIGIINTYKSGQQILFHVLFFLLVEYLVSLRLSFLFHEYNFLFLKTNSFMNSLIIKHMTTANLTLNFFHRAAPVMWVSGSYSNLSGFLAPLFGLERVVASLASEPFSSYMPPPAVLTFPIFSSIIKLFYLQK